MTISARTFATLIIIAAVALPSFASAAGKGTITASTLATTDTTPALSGTASSANTVRILVENGKGKDMYKSSKLKVKDEKWKATVGKKLPVGNYTVTLYGPKGVSRDTLATATLSILPKGSTATVGSTGGKSGTLSASPVALLMGGNIAHGGTAPVAYVKITNTGTSATSIKGFTLTENGTAPDDVVIGFTTNDDKGGSRTTVGGLESTKQFKNGSAYVPLAATIEPKQFRIFTIKAMLSQNSGAYFGKQLRINVASVDSSASVSGAFPMLGTTLTLVY